MHDHDARAWHACHQNTIAIASYVAIANMHMHARDNVMNKKEYFLLPL